MVISVSELFFYHRALRLPSHLWHWLKSHVLVRNQTIVGNTSLEVRVPQTELPPRESPIPNPLKLKQASKCVLRVHWSRLHWKYFSIPSTRLEPCRNNSVKTRLMCLRSALSNFYDRGCGIGSLSRCAPLSEVHAPPHIYLQLWFKPAKEHWECVVFHGIVEVFFYF